MIRQNAWAFRRIGLQPRRLVEAVGPAQAAAAFEAVGTEAIVLRIWEAIW